MAHTAGRRDEPALKWLRLAGWGAVALLLLAPAVAMRVAPNSGVNWTAGDFVFAALLMGAVGLAAELAVRISSNWSYRIGAAIGLGAGFLLIWVNLAVGYIGSEDNPYNQWFFAIVAAGFIGALIAGFRARGMALAMLAAGILHAIVGAIGYPQDTRTGVATIVFVALWLGSAALFRRAAREER